MHHIAEIPGIRGGKYSTWLVTHVKIEGYPDDREQPEDLVEPPEVPMEPLLLRLRQWEEKPVEEVDRHQRDGIQHERLEHIRADLRVAGDPPKPSDPTHLINNGPKD